MGIALPWLNQGIVREINRVGRGVESALFSSERDSVSNARIATLGQKKRTPKDIQALLRHSRLATTTDVYMHEIPESVKATVEAISKELRLKSE